MLEVVRRAYRVTQSGFSQHLGVLREAGLDVAVIEARRTRLSTGQLNRAVRQWTAAHPPPVRKGRRPKIHYVVQAGTAPPTFVLWANLPEEIPESYKRYLHNGFRDHWSFMGSPIRLNLRRKHEEDAA